METAWEMLISWRDAHFVIVDRRGQVMQVLVAGDSVDLLLAGVWQRVLVCSGGYRGMYYETSAGVRGRFALSMVARAVVAEAVGEVQTDELLEGVALVVLQEPQEEWMVGMERDRVLMSLPGGARWVAQQDVTSGLALPMLGGV